jgi:anti-anti-sigma factor
MSFRPSSTPEIKVFKILPSHLTFEFSCHLSNNLNKINFNYDIPLVINLENVKDVSSSVLGLFLNFYSHAQKHNFDLVICQKTDQLQRLLKLLQHNICKLVTCFPTQEEAINHLNRKYESDHLLIPVEIDESGTLVWVNDRRKGGR